jgi:DNA-binding NarL/FixJ family response regulator
MGKLPSEVRSFKTLIVEDNDSFRQVLKDLLQRHFPFLVLQEASGIREAQEKLGRCKAELVFMDIKLPDGNGLQLTETFKHACPQTAVIILTSYDYPEYREAAAQSGANHFISKEAVGEQGFLETIQSTLDEMIHHA